MNKGTFRITVRDIALIALFAAITAVFSQISIPTVPVPFTLSVLAVMLSACVLETKLAVLSQLVYILLGIAGAPVFAGLQSGPQRLVGPTGGFLASYIVIALVISMVLAKLPEYKVKWAFFANAAGLLPCYLLGAAWLGFSASLTLKEALASAVLPFIPFDLVKAGIAAVLGKRLKNALEKVRV